MLAAPIRSPAVSLTLFQPAENSLLQMRSRQAGLRNVRWTPLLMLVWSIWIFITPLYEPQYFRHWLWPTAISYPLFLLLFYRCYYRDRRHMRANALGIAALALLLTPFNPGGQSYVIYACAFLAFSGPPRTALAWMLGLLAVYAVEWLLTGWPLLFLLSTAMVSLAVGGMNIGLMRKAQADAALSLSHDEVRRLAALAERERIGRDLHDLLGHTLSLVALKSDLAARLVERDPLGAHTEMVEVSRVSREALAQVRRAVSGIRAAGLAAELASARLLLESSAVLLRYRIDEVALHPRLETAFALVLREAATNIQRHARARNAEVTLVCEGRQVMLQVRDDGRGGAMLPGTGLSGMRERLEALGGSLRIDSTPGSGTVLVASAPLPPAAIPAALAEREPMA